MKLRRTMKAQNPKKKEKERNNKVTTISTIKRHITVKELKSFLERVSYIRKFAPRPALLTSGLSKLLKNENAFIWVLVHSKMSNQMSNQMSFIKL